MSRTPSRIFGLAATAFSRSWEAACSFMGSNGAALIDEYLLMIHPLVLGTGIRLFLDGGPYQTLRLVERARTATTGVVIAVFQPAE